MSSRAARFTEADAVRGAKAAKRAGVIFEIGVNGVFRFIPIEHASLENPRSEVLPINAETIEPEEEIIL